MSHSWEHVVGQGWVKQRETKRERERKGAEEGERGREGREREREREMYWRNGFLHETVLCTTHLCFSRLLLLTRHEPNMACE